MIKNNLREARLKAGLTQMEVAKKLGLKSHNRISRWENGLANPCLEHFLNTAKILRVNPAKLFINRID